MHVHVYEQIGFSSTCVLKRVAADHSALTVRRSGAGIVELCTQKRMAFAAGVHGPRAQQYVRAAGSSKSVDRDTRLEDVSDDSLVDAEETGEDCCFIGAQETRYDTRSRDMIGA
eukprot:6213464-Pleurochrysis_carterae.AAC.2